MKLHQHARLTPHGRERMVEAVLQHRLTAKMAARQTNGKAERFIQTSLREWAYARTYQHSTVRAAHLPTFLHHYNWHRPHSALQHQPPISKLNLTMNNLMTLHS